MASSSYANVSSITQPSSLPDFNQYKDVKQKKTAFFKYLLPYVTQANAKIIKQRHYIESLDFRNLSQTDLANVKKFVKRYRLKYTEITPQTQLTLLKKIDIIPASLALAQAANETSWGTSRFARLGNNFFGQWCFTEGCGIVPLRRPATDKHEVKKFNSPLESVHSYMLTLNSHPAFKPLRDARRMGRLQNQPINGLLLVDGLEHYSARKMEYVRSIASMIRTNKLLQLDS
ncbi:MAG: glucosaminidase domain-containing protein [Pseudomonadota bacterium]|nr:glucosaminidase domain-containing protein [Pseudomonadota bacterium]